MNNVCLCKGKILYEADILPQVYGFNPLNAKLNPICRMLILLGDLTFMGTRIVSILQYISNKMQRYTIYVGFEPTISARERPAAVHLQRSWVRIPPGAWIFVCCECRVLSGRGLCDELITRPEES